MIMTSFHPPEGGEGGGGILNARGVQRGAKKGRDDNGQCSFFFRPSSLDVTATVATKVIAAVQEEK